MSLIDMLPFCFVELLLYFDVIVSGFEDDAPQVEFPLWHYE